MIAPSTKGRAGIQLVRIHEDFAHEAGILPSIRGARRMAAVALLLHPCKTGPIRIGRFATEPGAASQLLR